MDPEKASQVRSAIVWGVLLTVLHFALGTRTHMVHGLHILLAGLFLIPVITAAVALERRGGLIAAAAVSGAYLLHLLWSWRGSAMSNVDQFAWPAVYFTVGLTAGQLVHSANFRKWQRDQVILRSRQSEMLQGVTGLLTAVGVRDVATLAHCRRVAALATRLGEEMGLDRQALADLRLAGLVHDIGKAGLPDDVLFKNGQLDSSEAALMHNHVKLAESMLHAIPGTEAIARLVAQHHECPDGTGYPNGLRQGDIDPASHVLRVADVYAALTEARPYHEPLGPNGAIAVMFGIAGTKIDSAAFRALCQLIEDGNGELNLDDDGGRLLAGPGGKP